MAFRGGDALPYARRRPDQPGLTKQGRDPASLVLAPRQRQRTPVGASAESHNVTLPDAVFDRLQLIAIERQSNVSVIAALILDHNLRRGHYT